MTSKIPESVSKDCEIFFLLHDPLNKEKLPMSELGRCLRSVGYLLTETSVVKIKETFGNKKHLSLSDINKACCMAQDMKLTFSEDDIREACKIFQHDDSNGINSVEFKHMFMSLGEKFTEEEFDEFLKCIKINKEGIIDTEDLVEFLK